ncbi:group II intron-encoded protein LtrA [Carboxydocella sp. ULO1]|nr:group II intron-encoded protein LtrA [Carboxydocella sp. ULO1]
MKAIRRHTDNLWVVLYIQRWLKAPFQMPDGTVKIAEGNLNLFIHWQMGILPGADNGSQMS